MLLIRIEELKTEIRGQKAEIAKNKKTIEIINYVLGDGDQPAGPYTPYQKKLLKMQGQQIDEQKKAELEKEGTRLERLNTETIKLMEITNDRLKAAEKAAEKPQDGSTFILRLYLFLFHAHNC
jgi:predicted transcriptional regulator